MAWIAIDAGTSVIKAVLFADDGQEMALARRPAAVLHPNPDWSEQDMPGVWRSVVEAVQEVAAQSTEPLQGIVTTAQGDGAWLVDANGAPTGNAILWNDGRAAPLVKQWEEKGVIERAFRWSGSVAYPGLPNAIWEWLHHNQPERVERARWSLSCNGWIFLQLTDRYLAELSDASNPFSDVKERAYSNDVIAAFGAEANANRLPPIVAGKDAVAPLTESAAALLGVPARIACVMAPYDIIATAYGVGACCAGQACVILGTTICAETITADLDLAVTPSGTTIALHNGLFLRAMPTLTGCEALDWAAQMYGVDCLDALGELAGRSEPGSGGVFFLPYLSPAGERSPFLDTLAKGSFHGLSLRSTRADMVRAVYEGLSFVIRECLEASSANQVRELRVCGGGARSDVWCQLIADVTGVPVLRTADREIGARGAFLFALEVTGVVPSVAVAAKTYVQPAATFLPDNARNEAYSHLYKKFLKLRELTTAQWRIGDIA